MSSQNLPTLEILRLGLMREPLPEQVLAKLAPMVVAEHRGAKSVLFQEGAHFDSLILLVTGLVALDMYVPRRGAVRLLTVGPGEILGWSTVLSNQRMTATAIILEDADLIRIPAGPLQQLCATDHEVGYALMRRLALGLSRRLLATRLQLLDLFAEAPPTGGTAAPTIAPPAVS